jgi:hypothetical protein
MPSLFKSNANHLSKVLENLHNSQTMNHKLIILGRINQEKLWEVEKKVAEAIKILRTIN